MRGRNDWYHMKDMGGWQMQKLLGWAVSAEMKHFLACREWQKHQGIIKGYAK